MDGITAEQRAAMEKAGWNTIDPKHLLFDGELWLKGDDTKLSLRASGDHAFAGNTGHLFEAFGLLGLHPPGYVIVPVEVAQTAEGALVVAKAQMRTFAQTWERQGLSDAAAWAKKQAGAFAKAHRFLVALLHPAEGSTTHDGESR